MFSFFYNDSFYNISEFMGYISVKKVEIGGTVFTYSFEEEAEALLSVVRDMNPLNMHIDNISDDDIKAIRHCNIVCIEKEPYLDILNAHKHTVEEVF